MIRDVLVISVRDMLSDRALAIAGRNPIAVDKLEIAITSGMGTGASCDRENRKRDCGGKRQFRHAHAPFPS